MRQHNQLTKARNVLSSAMGFVAEVETAAFNFQDPLRTGCEVTPREKHIQSILSLQKKKLPAATSAQEKLLLVCACLSLAKDFRLFERSSGWGSKSEQLAARISNNEDAAVQKVGKHLGNYIASMDPSGHSESPDRCKLDAAVRFGMKLEVMDMIGASAGLPPCLSLLLGFECAKFSRLSYMAFGHLRDAMLGDRRTRERLLRFADLTGEWWARCTSSYHHQFGGGGGSRRESCGTISDLPQGPENSRKRSFGSMFGTEECTSPPLPSGRMDGNDSMTIEASPLSPASAAMLTLFEDVVCTVESQIAGPTISETNSDELPADGFDLAFSPNLGAAAHQSPWLAAPSFFD